MRSLWALAFDFGMFDVIIIHYSICILFEYFLPPAMEAKVKEFRGLKVQIIQDEYRWIDRMAGKMAELGISVVISSLEGPNLRRVYRQPEVDRIKFYSALPGYVPTDLANMCVPPIAERPLHMVYRGREVPYWLGAFSQDKARIAEQVRTMAHRHGLRADVGCSEESRIYGRQWIRFLLSGKAVAATEGGATIFDFDGEVERAVREFLNAHPGAKFNAVAHAVLRSYEGNIVHKTITPRCFEAIALRCALILYPGSYRGVLEPWRHYVPLMPDGSNEGEVVRRLRDDAYLQALVDRTYAEIVESGVYTLERYVRSIDGVIARSLDGLEHAEANRSTIATLMGTALKPILRLERPIYPYRVVRRRLSSFVRSHSTNLLRWHRV